MPESVWDNIYNGIKDFAGDENTANALIGGGIGAGIGGLIDGWRGAGIGALGGGIAGYKSNDIKNWWNTPTDKVKETPPKKARDFITKNDNLLENIAAGLIDENITFEDLHNMNNEQRNAFFKRNNIEEDNNTFIDTEATDIVDNNLNTQKYHVDQALLRLYKRMYNK